MPFVSQIVKSPEDSFWASKMVKRGFHLLLLLITWLAGGLCQHVFSIQAEKNTEEKKIFPFYFCGFLHPNYLFQMALHSKKPPVTTFNCSVSNTFLTFHRQNKSLLLSFKNLESSFSLQLSNVFLYHYHVFFSKKARIIFAKKYYF